MIIFRARASGMFFGQPEFGSQISISNKVIQKGTLHAKSTFRTFVAPLAVHIGCVPRVIASHKVMLCVLIFRRVQINFYSFALADCMRNPFNRYKLLNGVRTRSAHNIGPLMHGHFIKLGINFGTSGKTCTPISRVFFIICAE